MRFNRASSKPKISLRMHLKRIRVHKKCIHYKLNTDRIILDGIWKIVGELNVIVVKIFIKWGVYEP